MSDAKPRGGKIGRDRRAKVPAAPATRRCEDCDGDGRERVPCGAGDRDCEFCGGTGRVPRGGAKAADAPAKPGGQ